MIIQEQDIVALKNGLVGTITHVYNNPDGLYEFEFLEGSITIHKSDIKNIRSASPRSHGCCGG